MLLVRGLVLDPATIGQFAWTLIHFVWQGLFLAALLWAGLKVPRQAPLARYIASLVTLLLMVAAPALTFWSLHGAFDDPGPLMLPAELTQLPRPTTRPSDRALARASPDPSAAVQATAQERARSTTALAQARPFRWSLPPVWAWRIQRALPWVIVVWLTLALSLALRQAVALMMLRRTLKQNAQSLHGSCRRLMDLPPRMGVRRRVEFLQCPLLEVPATIGGRRPLVLVPSAAIDKLPAEQLDALVAHELAHIRRHDYIVNLVQSVLQAMLAFHPVVWWVSARVREEREHCCDEVAAGLVGSRKAYAEALKTMEQLRPTIAAGLALSAGGGPLLRRIRRLAGPSSQQRNISGAARAALLAPLITAGVLFLAAAQLIATSVNVEPPRGLTDVSSISGTIYQALGVTDGGGDMMLALRRVLDSASPDGKRFDPQLVDEFVFHINRDPRSAALLTVQLPLTSIKDRRDHQLRPQWAYRPIFYRVRLGVQLKEHAELLAAGGRPDAARQYARAAMLLGAQDAGLEGTGAITRVLKWPRFAELAQLTPRQAVRIQRAIDDHRKILHVCVQEHLRAVYSLRVVAAESKDPQTFTDAEIDAAREDLADAVAVMLRVSRGRPDIQWTVANICWQARGVLGDADAGNDDWRDRLIDGVDGQASDHLRRWVSDALRDPTPVFAHSRSAEDVRKQVRDWLERGMMIDEPPNARGKDKR